MSKKGRTAKKRKAHKARTKAKARAAKSEKRCVRCGETDRHLRRFKLTVNGKVRADWKTCRMCTAVLDVLVMDPRNHPR